MQSDNEPKGGGSRILYLTYDGLTDPLGRSQVLPYLQGLSALGHRIAILSFEKPRRLEQHGAQVAEICDRSGIAWKPVAYHKQPPVLSTLYDLAKLKREALRLHRAQHFDLVHCRSYIPAMAGLFLKQRCGVPFLFDMRGLWADERVDGNLWPQSNPLFRLIYRYVKRSESRLLREAAKVVSLTDAGRRELESWPALDGRAGKIAVIPCCADLDHFRPAGADAKTEARQRLGIAPDARVLAYLGSIGTWYLFDEMADFFRCYAERHPGARFLIVSPDDPEMITSIARRRGIDPATLVIRSASRNEVPQLLAAADAGLFFIKPAYSKVASSPTKMGEMMGMGLPLIANDGVGDVVEIIEQTRCGIVVRQLDDAGYRRAIDELDRTNFDHQAIRQSALELFDVRMGVERYDAIYRSLAEASAKAGSC